MTRQDRLEEIGFKFGRSGAHSARTMMLDEVRILFAAVPPGASHDRCVLEVVEHNVLRKPTRKARLPMRGRYV